MGLSTMGKISSLSDGDKLYLKWAKENAELDGTLLMAEVLLRDRGRLSSEDREKYINQCQEVARDEWGSDTEVVIEAESILIKNERKMRYWRCNLETKRRAK